MENIQALKLQLIDALDKYIEAKLASKQQAQQQSTQPVQQQAPAKEQSEQPQHAIAGVLCFERRTTKNGQQQVRITTDATGLAFMFASKYDAMMETDLQEGDVVEIDWHSRNGFKCVDKIALRSRQPLQGTWEEIDQDDEEQLPF